MPKRVIDSISHLSLTMMLEDRRSDATLILAHQGRRIETKVAGHERDIALEAYGVRDLETFGSLFDGPPPAHTKVERRAA